ncbi:MAG: PSD1 and planctomycete cytochrome C domain-containing protein [Planctomycetota bacterium]|jgi:hypothetical protein
MRLRKVIVTVLGAGSAVAVAGAETPAAIDFNRDIRPILSDRCYRCHGPDEAARQAKLRLDLRDAALAARGPGRAAIVPGDPDASLVMRRITSIDPDDLMPPPESNKTLSGREIELIRRWIAEGAAWDTHWAFVPPHQDDPPATAHRAWARNPIDRFVAAELEARGLAPSPEATKEALLRRVTFDLTGLPPTLEEIDAFLADVAPDAYERVVDRLLASPRYGERMAMVWLDAARYADTHGYHYDNERSMWRWRDWVVDAYNRNLPFDEFTTQQLAGDLLPDATLDEQIATGFNRNHGITWEGGVIPEEYRIEYVVDRVQTTSTVWLGLTMGCARCHDHKFDPISQREFYAFSAFFNSIPEKGADGLNGNAEPLIPAPDDDLAPRLDALDAQLADLQGRYDAPSPAHDDALLAWEDETAATWERTWTVLEPFAATTDGGGTLTTQADGSVFAEGPHAQQETYEIVAFTDLTGITAVRLEAMADERLPRGGPGRASHANYVLSELELEVTPVGDPDATRTIPFVAAHADHCQKNFFITKTIDGNLESGWAVEGADFGEDRVAVYVPLTPFGFDGGTALRFRLRYQSKYMQHSMGRVRLAVSTSAELAERLAPTTLGPWHAVGPFPGENGRVAHDTAYGPETSIDLDAAYGDDGALAWRLLDDGADGVVHKLEGENASTYLHRVITAPDDRAVDLAFGSDDTIKVWVNGALVHESAGPRGAAPDQDLVTVQLDEGANDLLVKITNFGGPSAWFFDRRDDRSLDPPLEVLAKLHRPRDGRTDGQRTALRDFHLRRTSPEHRALLDELATRRSEREALAKDVPTVMVMRALDEPRETHVLMRGRYDLRGEVVTAGVPGVLPGLPPDAIGNRLTFSRWLMRPDHPLTARVAINRYWQMYFGRGLVDTPEDFGVQGSLPSHPALLDWLAVEFARTGWDVKAMQKLIVTSATYRQSSAFTPTLREVDPDNRLLARGPRFRLPAEMIRDSALAVAGLLVDRRGGPPVKPYQPEGLWKEVGSDFSAFSANVYERDSGDGLYRRSLYTFWKRTLPPPAMATFDAPSREFCVMQRSRTNTPLQALVLMNDPTYVEAARFLAQRVLEEADDDLAARVDFAFRAVTGRTPSRAERAVLVDLYEEQLAALDPDDDSIVALLGVGDGVHPPDLDRRELVAWSVVASVLLNLDEFVMRG